MGKLAQDFQDRSEHRKAEGFFRKLHEIRPAAWSHQSWDSFFADYATTLIALDRFDEATDILLAHGLTVLDVKHSRTVETMIDLVKVFRGRNEHENAEDLFRNVFSLGLADWDDES